MMTRDSIAAVVISSISRVLEIPEAGIREDARLAADLGADSIALVQIADLVEDTCADRGGADLRFLDADLARLPTVASTIDYLSHQVAR